LSIALATSATLSLAPVESLAIESASDRASRRSDPTVARQVCHSRPERVGRVGHARAMLGPP
jgi:hypothetical protein